MASILKIIDLGEKYAVTENGFTLHTEKSLDSMFDFCRNELAGSWINGQITVDLSPVYFDERGRYVTHNDLVDYWNENPDVSETFEENFNAYVADCCGKNGTLRRLEV